MHLAIDIREACGTQPTGKGRWTRGFVDELLRRPGISVTLLCDAKVPDAWRNARTECFEGRGLRWHWRAAQWLLRRRDVLYLSPTSYIVPAIAGRRARVVPVVHDLIAFDNEPHDRRARWIERLTLPRTLRSAAHVLAISESTAEELQRRFPWFSRENATVVHAGPTCEPGDRQDDCHTILCIATLCPRKNQLGLLRAYASLPKELRSQAALVLAGGRGWKDDEIVAAAQSTPGASWLGYVDDRACQELLRRAHILAFPSFEEGFGMPVLDAFRQGVPVLTSDRSSMREVAGDAAVLVDPSSTASIAAGLERLLGSPGLRAALREKGKSRAELFTWPKTVDRALAVLESL